MTQVETVTREKIGDRVIIFKRGTKWWAQFSQDGKQQKKSLKTSSKKQARTLAIQLEAELLSGSYKKAVTPCAIREAADAYLLHLRTENRAEATLVRYGSELDRFEAFARGRGVSRLSQVTIRLVEQYRAERAEQIKPRTLHHETVLVKQLVNYAVSRDLLGENPLKNLKVRKPRSAPRPTYTPEQVEDILEAAREPYRSLFELLAFTGLRIGEAKFLTWRDVDLAGGWLHVRAKDGWKPKTGRDRKLPLNDRARSVLERLPHVGRWVFFRKCSDGAGVHTVQIDERRVLKELKSALGKVGIDRGTVHEFRHFFVSLCAQRGVSPFQLMEWVGHRDLSTVLIYYHGADEASQRAMASVSSGAGTAPADAELELVQK